MDFKKNGFWIALASGVAVAVLVFALLVLPKWTEEGDVKAQVIQNYDARLKSIAAGGPTVPGTAWSGALGAHDKAVMEESKSLYKFFADSDAASEKWFEDKEPPKGLLMSQASTGLSKMHTALRDAKIQVFSDGKGVMTDAGTGGFEFPASENVQDTLDEKRRWMRVYNIHARIKDALLEGEVKKFYRCQYSPFQSPEGFSAIQRSSTITNELGDAFPFLLDCATLWKDVPKLLAAILKYDPAKPGPMFRIIAVRIEREPNAKIAAEIKETVEKENYNQDTWKPLTQVSEEPLRVFVYIEALDFKIPEARLK